MASERCPSCDRPRPRGAFRCACNYTFEYVSDHRARVRRSPSLDAALGAAATFAAIAGYACVPGEPDHAGVGILLAVAGLFAAFAAVANITWFFASARARLVTLVLGRAGARVAYAILGGALVGAGAQLALAG